MNLSFLVVEMGRIRVAMWQVCRRIQESNPQKVLRILSQPARLGYYYYVSLAFGFCFVYFYFILFVCLLVFLRKGFSVQSQMFWILLFRPGCPQTHEDLLASAARIKGVHHLYSTYTHSQTCTLVFCSCALYVYIFTDERQSIFFEMPLWRQQQIFCCPACPCVWFLLCFVCNERKQKVHQL